MAVLVPSEDWRRIVDVGVCCRRHSWGGRRCVADPPPEKLFQAKAEQTRGREQREEQEREQRAQREEEELREEHRLQIQRLGEQRAQREEELREEHRLQIQRLGEQRGQREEEHRLQIQQYDARERRLVVEVHGYVQRQEQKQRLEAQELHRYVEQQHERERRYLHLQQTMQGMQACLPASTTRGLAAADIMEMLLRAVDNELLCLTCTALATGRSADEFKRLGITLVEDCISFGDFYYALEKLDKNNKRKGKGLPDWQWLDGIVNQAVWRVERAVDKVVGTNKGKGIQLQFRENLTFFLRAIKPLRIAGAHSMNLYEHRSVKKSLLEKKVVSRRKLALRTITTEEHAMRKEICKELRRWLASGVGDNELERVILEVKDFALVALRWYEDRLSHVQVH